MKELPSGWIWTTLGEVARWGSGGTPQSGDPRLYGGQIPWAVIGDLNDGIVYNTAQTVTEQGLSESSAKMVPEHSVLVAMYGASIGRLGMTGRPMTTNQAIAFAMPTAEIELKYLFYYLMSQPRSTDQT